MRFGTVSVAFLIATLYGQETNQPAPAVKHESGSVAGQVVNSVTGEPVNKAAISVWRSGEWYEATSTAGGGFVIRDMKPGKYHIGAVRRGYSSASSRSGAGTTLSVDSGQHLEGVVLRLLPQAVITGHALDDDGEPLPNVEVFLLRYSFSRGKRSLERSDQARTNDLGEYRMFGLSPGRYYVSATYYDFHGLPQAYDSGHGFVPTYYPGTSDPAGAKAIDLQAGTILRGLDIALLKTRTVRVRGHVVDLISKAVDASSKQVTRNVGVALERREQSQSIFSPSLNSQADPQGNFEIRSVTPGAYVLEAFTRAEGKQYRAQQLLDVDESDIENVVLELTPPGELKGQVRFEGRTLANPAEMQILLEDELTQTGGRGGQVRPDGSFTISDIGLGRYRVDFCCLSDDYYLKSARLGEQEALESGLDLTHGIGGPLEITLCGNGGRLEGVVLNANDEPVQNATIVLVPDEPRRGQWRLYRDVTTDQYGRFTIKSIAPGGYKLFAWEQIEDGAYENPDFLKDFEVLGEPRTIREGSHESAQLKLIPAGDRKTAPK